MMRMANWFDDFFFSFLHVMKLHSSIRMYGLFILALGVGDIVANFIVDDLSCYWDDTEESCMPKEMCVYNFKLGDFSYNASCRVKDEVNLYPQQLHLAYAGVEAGTAMTVSWATYADVTDCAVWIGETEDTLKRVKAPIVSQSYYSDKEYFMLHHHATISGLKPRTKYFYKVGSKGDEKYTSDINTFITARPATDKNTFNVLVYGDLGEGKFSVDSIAAFNKMTSDDIDLVYHLGDIGYADNDYLNKKQSFGFFYEEVYNSWMNAMMPIMSRVPYMVLVGNHEAECHSPSCLASHRKSRALGNYTAYNVRFRMPHQESNGVLNMWHSFDHGPIHFTSISTETDYPNAPSNVFSPWTNNGNFGDQLSWLEADLKKAHANRADVPWIFVGMHRPLYSIYDAINGIPVGRTLSIQAAFEDLFIKYKVDVVLSGHVHYYERQFPVAKNKPVLDGVSSDGKVYDNPKAPVYILTGGPGQSEGLTLPPAGNATWRAAYEYLKYGYSMLQANRTTLTWIYVASTNQTIQDNFVMIKDEVDAS
ncbi:calcineurin-like phosphoesterase [Plasmopara halstedii]|uniref:Purple acid phosphatase n=1 Tax=Plasmopara halstedii TaxID=4781 RepID=A0A0P1B5P9_PLAHL|nr:calcineurin-like phosphoesterase [Plasmopara halstedii]CEG49357.1 calcineurin-like phosphoesterase [Plasmopara halstedii]|eukprot:XP_024585726.1 calcineurin-like phosphoesterase [Plasmopara halstedii]